MSAAPAQIPTDSSPRGFMRRGSARLKKLGLDTYADEPRFTSYRRATHRGEQGYGREIAVIGL